MTTINKIKEIYHRGQKFGFRLQGAILLINKFHILLPKPIFQLLIKWKDDYIRNTLKKNWQNIDFENIHVEYNNDPQYTIWFCWLQGEDKMPEIPKLCLNSLKKYAHKYQIIVLTLDNYKKHVSLPDNIVNLFIKKKMCAAHFSDCMRVNLLYQKGGCWIDATMLLTAPIEDRIFTSNFFTIKNSPSDKYLSKCKWAGFFMASKKNNILMGCLSKMYELYWSQYDCIIDYLLMDYMIEWLYNNNSKIKEIIDKVPFTNPSIHQLSKKINSKFSDREWRLLSSETTMFKLNWRLYTSEQLKSNHSNYYNYLLNKVN